MDRLNEKDTTSQAAASIDDYTDTDRSTQADNRDIKKRKDKKKDQDTGKGILKKDSTTTFDAGKYIDTEPRLDEALTDKAVVTFGRMNPPTVGHEKLVNEIIKNAIAVKGTPLVYLSKTQDAKKNPLSYDDKIKFGQALFGKKILIKSQAKTIIEVFKELQKKGFKEIVMVAGSDRVNEFDTLLNKYNGKDYTFDSIKVVSAGERDPDSDGVDGMSASKMRALAADGNSADFSKGVLSTNKSLVVSLYKAVRKGLGINEQTNFAVGQFLAERVKAGKVDPLSAMGKQKLTGAEVASYYKSNPNAKAAAGRDKQVKLGIELALDLSGNMNYAIKEIDKVKKNLSKHPEVQKALKSANESVNHDVYRASSFQERLKIEEIQKASIKEKFIPVKEDRKSDLKDLETLSVAYTDQTNKGKKATDPKMKALDKEINNLKDKLGVKGRKSTHTNKFKKMFGESVVKVKPNMERAGLKRPHQLLRQDNTVNFDYRFKMYGKAREAEAIEKQRAQIESQITEQKIEDLYELIEQVEFVSEKSNPEKSLKDKADKSGMPLAILRKVFERGVAAWKTSHRPGTTPVQWGLARVNSFATKSPGTWGKADKDLADKVNG